jgi:hypothetical protein
MTKSRILFLLLLIALAMLIPLTSYDISIQRRDSEKQATPQAYPFGIQLEPIIPEAHALDIISDDFGSGLSGWTYGAIPGYSQCGGYTLTRDTGTGNPAPSAYVYGDSYNCYAGMKKTVSLTGWTYPNQLMLSFNWRAASGYASSTVTNMFIYIYDGSTYLYGATLVYGGTYDTGWRTWGPTDIAGSVGSRSSITIYFFLVDGWSANWSQRNWADNVRLSYTPTTVTVTFQTSGAGSDASGNMLTIDGTGYTYAQLPASFTWTVSSTHSIAASSPVPAGTGKQYVWTAWSDGGAQSHTYTVPSSSQTVTANYKTQYYLTVNSAYGSPSGAGWYDSGATASFSVSSPVSGPSGTQYVCTGYSGDASGSGASGSIVMNGPKTVTFSWKTQYQLTMTVSPSGGGTTVPAVGTYWYDAGSEVTTSATANSGYLFESWSGSGTGSYTGTSNPASVTMNAPITQTANFVQVVTITFQLLGVDEAVSESMLTIDGVGYAPSELPKSFSWIVGSTHTLAATSPVSCGSGCQYVWASWSDGGAQSHTYTTPTSAQTVTATYTKQYQVTFAVNGISSDATGTVVTVNGAAKTLSQLPYTAWYDSGATVTYSFASPVSASSGKQYAWLSTSGLGQTAQSGTFTASASGTVTATYRTQFELTIQVDPPGTGNTNPAAGTYWYNAGEAVQLSAAGSGGYVFTSWTGTGTGSYTGTDNPATITMNAPITETANFAQLATMTVSYEILDGGSPTPPTFNYVLGGVSKTYTLTETPTPIQADPSSAWSVTPNPLGGSSLTERWYSNQTLSGTASSTTLVFKFQHEYKFTIQVNNPQYGTTAPIPADYWQRPQQSIQVTATPAGNCRFDHWELDRQNAGSSTQYTVTMDAPHTLQAVFMMNSHQVTITAIGTGPDAVSTIVTVDGVTYDPTRLPLTLYWEDGSIHTVEAAQSVSTSVSGKCYNWNQWSDGRTGRILQVTATSTLTLTASFKTQYLLSAYSIPTGAETTKNPDSTTGFYDPGTTVQLTASNDYGGLAFVRWLLNGEPQPQGQTSLTVTMSEPSVAIVMYEMKQQQSITVPAYDAVFTSLASLLILAAVLIATRRRH